MLRQCCIKHIAAHHIFLAEALHMLCVASVKQNCLCSFFPMLIALVAFLSSNTQASLQALFKKEVSETFLRCVKMGYKQDLAVIELNGLKIAEDRTFADCARHVFASILDLCLPHPVTCKAEYQSLYQQTAPDTDTQVNHLLLHQLAELSCSLTCSVL